MVDPTDFAELDWFAKQVKSPPACWFRMPGLQTFRSPPQAAGTNACVKESPRSKQTEVRTVESFAPLSVAFELWSNPVGCKSVWHNRQTSPEITCKMRTRSGAVHRLHSLAAGHGSIVDSMVRSNTTIKEHGNDIMTVFGAVHGMLLWIRRNRQHVLHQDKSYGSEGGSSNINNKTANKSCDSDRNRKHHQNRHRGRQQQLQHKVTTYMSSEVPRMRPGAT